jgi:hypothetical protein
VLQKEAPKEKEELVIWVGKGMKSSKGRINYTAFHKGNTEYKLGDSVEITRSGSTVKYYKM